MVPGIMPLIPPPSMLRTVMRFPYVGDCKNDLALSMIDCLTKMHTKEEKNEAGN